MDQMRMQQRNKRMPLHQTQIPDADVLNEDEYDDVWPTRMPSSSRRYTAMGDVRMEVRRKQADAQSTAARRLYATGTSPERFSSVPPRRTATQTSIPAVQSDRRHFVHTDEVLPPRGNSRLMARHRSRFHWLVFVGLAMFIMIIGWIAFGALANWWQVTQDDWQYGRPRTFQVNAAVGHNDSTTSPSHFIAINLNRHIMIIEVPGGDPTKTKTYSGPLLLGDGQNLTPVTLTFKDVNGDGKPDMIVNVQDSHFVFINENGGFRPARPDENIQS